MQKAFTVQTLERTILPIVLVLGSKYIIVFLLNIIFSYSWKFSFSTSQIFSLPFVQYYNTQNLIMVNSISSFFMTLVLATGFAWTFYRFQFFHENFVEPKVSARLHSNKMESLILKEVSAHSQMTVWFSLAWFTFILILLEFLAGTVTLFVLSTNFIIVLLLSSATIMDMHKKGARKVKRK